MPSLKIVPSFHRQLRCISPLSVVKTCDPKALPIHVEMPSPFCKELERSSRWHMIDKDLSSVMKMDRLYWQPNLHKQTEGLHFCIKPPLCDGGLITTRYIERQWIHRSRKTPSTDRCNCCNCLAYHVSHRGRNGLVNLALVLCRLTARCRRLHCREITREQVKMQLDFHHV